MMGISKGSLIVFFSFSDPHDVGDKYTDAANNRMNPRMKQKEANP
jgi:hypothetical protein